MGIRKRKPLLSDELLNSPWALKPFDCDKNVLKNFDMLISSAVSRCLEEDNENRSVIAEIMSLVLDEDISINMLNGWASPARRDHFIQAYRFFALIAITRRYDILDTVLREIDAKALDRIDSKIFQVGKAYVSSVNSDKHLKKMTDELYDVS